MQLNKFDGGLSVRQDATLIAPTEAVIYNNINNDVGSLTSAASYTVLGQAVYGFFYNFKGTWLGSDQQRSYVEYNDKLYVTENNKTPQVYSGGVYKNIGIVGPAVAPELSQASATASFLQDKDIQANGLAARDLYITSDGYTLYTLDETNDAIDQYELSTAWDISTAVYSKTKSISAQETNAMGLTFKPNGTKFYVIGNNRYVYEYTMTVAWDVSTAAYSTSYNAGTQNTTPQGLHFSDTGLKLFILDGTTGRVNEYTLSTAYQLSTITFSTYYLTAGTVTGDSALTGLFFNSSGTRLYLAGYTNDKIYEFVLGTAWDITTAIYYGILGDIATESTTVTGLFFSPDIIKLYITTEPSSSKIVQYNVNRISSEDSTLQYVYTYYNSVDDVESVPSPVSVEFDVKAVRSVIVSGLIASTDPQVDKIRLYRIGDNATSFTLVAEISNSLSSYLDNIPTTDLEDLLEAQDYYPMPSEGQYLVEANGILFCAVGSKVYFSVQGKPCAWPESYYVLFEKTITGLLPIADGLIVFMLDRADILLGTTISEFSRKTFSKEHGCVNHYSTGYVQNTAVWLSKRGFCIYASGSVKVVTRDKLGLTNYDVVNTAVFDQAYFIALQDGSLLVIDTKYDTIRYGTYSYNIPIHTLLSTDGVLYARSSNSLLTLFTGELLELHYKSPKFIEESFTEVKTYNNIYVRASGTFTFNVYIDDELVKSYSLTGSTTHDLKVPQEKQKGYSIQFEIIGTGTVHEIEYKVMGRQNGR